MIKMITKILENEFEVKAKPPKDVVWLKDELL